MADGERRYHHGDLRNALLSAADALLAEKGVHDFSLREVARRAGVSHGAPAHHFANKRALLAAYAVRSYAELVAGITERIARGPIRDARDVLMAVGDGYIAYATAHPARFEVMFRRDLFDVDGDEMNEVTQRTFGALVAAVEACVTQGLLPAQDARAATVMCWSMVHGFSALWNCGWLGVMTGETDAPALGHLMNMLATWRIAPGSPSPSTGGSSEPAVSPDSRAP